MEVPVSDRLFVAIWPDATARTALAVAVDREHAQHPEVRWQAPERWHITLAFLGEADVDRAVRRLDALARAGLPEPDPVHLRAAGSFGPVVWVGVAHGPWLAELADRAQRRLGVADRRFRAHVTVGRSRGPDAHRIAREAVASLADHTGPPWLPEALTLVRSVTGPHPEYHEVARWPFPA